MTNPISKLLNRHLSSANSPQSNSSNSTRPGSHPGRLQRFLHRSSSVHSHQNILSSSAPSLDSPPPLPSSQHPRSLSFRHVLGLSVPVSVPSDPSSIPDPSATSLSKSKSDHDPDNPLPVKSPSPSHISMLNSNNIKSTPIKVHHDDDNNSDSYQEILQTSPPSLGKSPQLDDPTETVHSARPLSNSYGSSSDLHQLPNISSRPLSSRNPLQLLSSRIKASRSKSHGPTPDSVSGHTGLRHKPSSRSLIERFKPEPSPAPVGKPTRATHSQLGSFELKSFRNVRSPAGQTSSQNTPSSSSVKQSSPPLPGPANSIYTLSRPASPSPRISAAAFREAQAARRSRTSFSSSRSDLLLPEDSTLNLAIPSSSKALSDIGHYSSSTPKKGQKRKSVGRRSTTAPLINQIPGLAMPVPVSSRPPPPPPPSSSISSFQSLAPNPAVPLPPPEHDVLVPPRPAFYGSSRAALRSVSVDQRQSFTLEPRHLRQPNSKPGPSSLYTVPPNSSSRLSVRSLPSVAPPSNPRQRSKAGSNQHPNCTSGRPLSKTSRPAQEQLDKWHSDEEDESPKSAPSKRLPPSSTATATSASVFPLPSSSSSFSISSSSSLSHQQNQGLVSALKMTPKDKVASGDVDQGKDEDEDEVPLSQLKKKSITSLRETAAAQTLARGREQLHQGLSSLDSSSCTSSPLRPSMWSSDSALFSRPFSSHISHSSCESITTGVSVPPLPGNGSSSGVPSVSRVLSDNSLTRPPAPPSLKVGATMPRERFLGPQPSTFLNPRGNSPVSSSSGGSGSGSWSVPLTPHDSTGNVHSLSSLSSCSMAMNPMLQNHHHKGRVTFDSSASDKHSSCGHASSIKSHDSTPRRRLSESSESKSFKAGNNHPLGQPISEGIDTATPKPNTFQPSPLGMMGWQGYQPAAGMPVGFEEIGAPAGVDSYLYSSLGVEQKMQLHQRSQMMMQMMAAQAQQMQHAMALAQPPGGMMMGYNGILPPVGWPTESLLSSATHRRMGSEAPELNPAMHGRRSSVASSATGFSQPFNHLGHAGMGSHPLSAHNGGQHLMMMANPNNNFHGVALPSPLLNNNPMAAGIPSNRSFSVPNLNGQILGKRSE